MPSCVMIHSYIHPIEVESRRVFSLKMLFGGFSILNDVTIEYFGKASGSVHSFISDFVIGENYLPLCNRRE